MGPICLRIARSDVNGSLQARRTVAQVAGMTFATIQRWQGPFAGGIGYRNDNWPLLGYWLPRAPSRPSEIVRSRHYPRKNVSTYVLT
jgi:hypothetical protein